MGICIAHNSEVLLKALYSNSNKLLKCHSYCLH